MILLQEAVDATPVAMRIVDSADALRTFLEPDCVGAIWRRQTPLSIQAWLDGLDPEVLPRVREIVPMGSKAETLSQLCDIMDLPAGPERDWLFADIAFLANTFSRLMSAPCLRLRLDVVTTNACRKFHVDAMKARLVCTYRGTGTQFGLSANGGAPERVFTVQTGAPILLRGTRWPAVPPSGLLHRSPPIEGTGETRLVLVLDPVLDPDDDL